MLGILGLIFVIVAPFLVYRTAKQNGHNVVFWTIISVIVGVGVQIILPAVIGFTLGMVWALKGSTIKEIEDAISTPANIIGIIALILSVIGILAVMKKVGSIHEKAFEKNQPPPPPNFN
jgi:hypothetical protein